MGTLVFQATLGGAVNIIGPNIANTINFTLPSADGTSGQTWTTNGSGVLAFGTLGIAGGGTGQITATAAFNALAPSQSGQSGKYLTTDGTNTSWGTNPLGTVTSVAVSGGTTGLTTSGGPITTSGTITFAGTLATSNGGTGLSGATPFTSGGVVYASSTSALATGSALTYNGNILLNQPTTGTGFSLSQYVNTGGTAYIGLDNSTGGIFSAYALNIYHGGAYPIIFATSGAERMRITSAGDVGIGTSSPSQKLSVAGTILATTTSTPAIIAKSTSFGIQVFYNDGRTEFTSVNYDGLSTNGAQDLLITSGQKITFGVNSNGTISYPLTINTAGNLGLGTSSPTSNGSGNTVLDIASGSAKNANLWLHGNNTSGSSTGLQIQSASDLTAYLWNFSNAAMVFGTNNTEKARITSDGYVGIGTSSPATYGAFAVRKAVTTADTTNCSASFSDAANSTLDIGHTANIVRLNAQGSTLAFNAGSAERARITSGGDLYVGTTTGTIGTANFGIVLQNDGAIIASRNQNGGVACFYFGGNAGYAQVLGNGNLQNSNGVYGTVSDIKLKENIVDASPKLADLMQVKVRNYNLIGDTTKQLGVVAQELETVFPAMVSETTDKDAEGNDLGTATKAVKYSVFVPMLIKAMQEQQAIIESLKARLDAANL
jgi:hypothetical protein